MSTPAVKKKSEFLLAPVAPDWRPSLYMDATCPIIFTIYPQHNINNSNSQLQTKFVNNITKLLTVILVIQLGLQLKIISIKHTFSVLKNGYT